MKRKLMMVLALILIAGMHIALADDALRMYAANVGKGDALLLTDGEGAALVDTGYAWSIGKIRAAMNYLGVESLDAVFITHTDKDHIGCLDWLSRSDIPIGAWYASAEYTGIKKESKHPVYEAAASRGQSVEWLSAGDTVAIGSMVFQALAPSVNSENENDNSLVMMLSSPNGSILLAGDMEFNEEDILLTDNPDLACDVLKVPNHADDDTASDTFLAACSPKAAVISTSSYEKPETPDARIVYTLELLGASVYVTQDATGGILISLTDGVPGVEKVNLDENSPGITLESVVPGDDIIVLRNPTDTDVDLSGWYLVSDRGNEYYVIPEGTTLNAGATCTIGTNTTKLAVDLTWNDKKVIHTSKTDTIGLFDANGFIMDAMTNGL